MVDQLLTDVSTHGFVQICSYRFDDTHVIPAGGVPNVASKFGYVGSADRARRMADAMFFEDSPSLSAMQPDPL